MSGNMRSCPKVVGQTYRYSEYDMRICKQIFIVKALQPNIRNLIGLDLLYFMTS